ncbi:MAG: hypothetical protein JW953_00175 [Anaerolineae bacterium]|nr:hypothetical protein [Anaerolineae bacterium]
MADNKNVMTRDTEQIRDIVQDHWTKFTEEDLKKIEAMRNEFVGMVQQRYGYAKQRAEEEVDRALRISNARLEGMAQKLPGEMDQALLRYPWVTIVTALGVGFILGFALKPRR